VIHYQTPGSVVAYYQQVGRAGRALDGAYGILLSGEEETDITNFFIESAFPTPEEVQKVLETIDRERRGLSVPELMG
jgi:ATP-dependent DNA helicase RecQ